MVGESKAGIHIIKIMGSNVQWQSNKKKCYVATGKYIQVLGEMTREVHTD